MAASILLVVGVALAYGTFTDDDGNIHEAAIELIAAEGITKGCNPPSNNLYCPDSSVTRGQMAAFVRRAFSLPSSSTDFFVDDDDSIFEGDINAVAVAGITKGCNPPANDRFCPDGKITREQMAAFLRRAFGYPAASTDYFVDDDVSIFEADINAIAKEGVTKGCNPPANDRYCPTALVKRDQMASFFARALGLPTTTTTVAPPEDGSIRGTVTEEGTGTPLLGITVEVMLTGSTHVTAEQTTAADGTYDIDSLEADVYDVYFEDPLAVYADKSVHDVVVSAGTATTVDAQLISQAIAHCRVQSSIPALECETLIDLYNSTNGPAWDRNADWLTETNPCDWWGVTCSGGTVTRLDLGWNELSGPIPTELENLTNLTRLDLTGNRVSGPIPTELGNLTNLTNLGLGFSELSGAIPTELGNLTNLTYLHLAVSGVSGAIPTELGNLTNLTNLYLDANGLSGPVPPELMDLTILTSARFRDQNGCLTAATPDLAAWLTGHDPLWNDGCPAP